MVGLFQKPLLYKEWRSARWVGLLMVLGIVFSKIIGIMDNMDYLKISQKQNHEHFVSASKNWLSQHLLGGRARDDFYMFMIILVAFLAVVIFYHDRKGSTSSLVFSLPYTRIQIFAAKWIVGMGIICGTFIIALGILTMFYFNNINFIDEPYYIVIQWVAINMFLFMAYYSGLMLTQALMGNSIVAGVVGPIVFAVPFVVLDMLREFISANFGLKYNHWFIENMYRVGRVLTIYFLPDPEYVQPQTQSDYGSYVYNDFMLKIFILAILALVFCLIGSRAFINNRVENTGNVLMFKQLLPVLKWGVAICLGLLLGVLFRGNYEEPNVVLMDCLLIGGILVGYLGTKKINEQLSMHN
ncbi:MAG: ABC transporter permease [Clostridia bacterium]|nr:ABC transporter permease [Clostridia bacterium]